MAKTIKEERLRWVLPIVRKEIRLAETAKLCPYGKRNLERWVATYRKQGEDGLEPKSTEPKRYRKETPIRLKERVILANTAYGGHIKFSDFNFIIFLWPL